MTGVHLPRCHQCPTRGLTTATPDPPAAGDNIGPGLTAATQASINPHQAKPRQEL